MNIGAWLRTLGLECYEKAFADNDIAPAVLVELTDQDLRDLGVSLGHRRLLLKAIKNLEIGQVAPAAPTGAVAPPRPSEPGPPSEAQRRQLTVLFCDLVGSTELSSRLDPEDLRYLMRGYHDCCASVIERWHGHVAKFLGDGVLAYFGYPRLREDDAERAVRAGLGLVRAVAQLELRPDLRLQARVGIASGLAVVGDLIGEGAAREEAVVGDTPNLAARLQALAEPGGVVIAPATRRLVGGFFELVDLGVHHLKGVAAPMRVWRPVRGSAARSRFEALRGGSLTPLVGRQPELEVLSRLLEQAAAGHGQIAAAVGDPGLGKSRLIDAFLRSDSVKGWRVISCGCRPDGANMPWLPVVELIKAYLGIGDRDDQTQVGAKIIEGLAPFAEVLRPAQTALRALLDLPIEDPEWRALNPPQRRRRILDAVKGLLQLHSAREPLVLVFEDLHWADSETVALLHSLVDSLPAMRALLLVNYRPEFEHGWSGRTCYTQLRIDPLGDDQSERLLAILLGDDTGLGALRSSLIERTHGNPLFLEEAVRDLAETGKLAGEPGRYRLADAAGAIRLPDTVQAILAARIDRLPAPSKQLLQRAAVIGQEVPLPVLEAVADLSAEQVSERIGELQTADLLYEARVFPDVAYTFKHALTHEMAYVSLLRETRRTLHRRVGEAIELIYPGRLAELAEALTDHFERGEVWAPAARYALDATEKAKSRYAYPVGMQYARRALAAAANDASLTQESIWASVQLGDLASLINDLDLANQSYDQARAKSEVPTERRWITNKCHQLRFADREGARIAHYVHGSGTETILFVSPIGYGVATWQSIVERLCQEFRIVTIDLRGTGRSSPLVPPYTERDHALDIAAVVAAVSDRPVVGVGISAAPYALVRAAVADPKLFKQLVLVGGDPGTDLLPGGDNFPELPAIKEALANGDAERAARLFTPYILSEPGTEELIEQRVQAYKGLPKETLSNFFTVAYPTSAEFGPLLERLRLPTLVMHGTADKASPLEVGRQLAARIPGAQFYAFEGRCHLPMVTATKEFCDVVRAFVLTGEVSVPVDAPMLTQSVK
jgi:class 3 adenylate cyclase/pimeloyl-ACP methyl ester carboxylesterase